MQNKLNSDNATAWTDFANGDDSAASRVVIPANHNKPVRQMNPESQTKGKFTFISVDQMEIKEPEFLIDELVEIQNLALIFGESGCGKSFIALDMASCIATGRPFHGRDVKQGLVFYIAGEGQNGLRRRFTAWEKHNDVALGKDRIFISKIAGDLVSDRTTADIVAAIRDLSQQHGEAALIVIDTVARSFGSGDENSQQHMNKFVANADRLKAEFHSSTIMLVHHTGHGDQSRARGSSVLKAAMDAEYRVSKKGDIISIKNTKMKDSEPPEPLYFELKSVELGKNRKGKLYSSAVLISTGKPVQSSPKAAGNDLLALEALEAAIAADEDQSASKKQWREEFYRLHSSDKTETKATAFRRALASLVEGGSVIALEDDHYSLP